MGRAKLMIVVRTAMSGLDNNRLGPDRAHHVALGRGRWKRWFGTARLVE